MCTKNNLIGNQDFLNFMKIKNQFKVEQVEENSLFKKNLNLWESLNQNYIAWRAQNSQG